MSEHCNTVFGMRQTESGIERGLRFGSMPRKSELQPEHVVRARGTLAKAVKHHMDRKYARTDLSDTDRAIDLGHLAGVGKTTIIALLKHSRDVGLDKIARLAQTFGLGSADALLSPEFAPTSQELAQLMRAVNGTDESREKRSRLHRRRSARQVRRAANDQHNG